MDWQDPEKVRQYKKEWNRKNRNNGRNRALVFKAKDKPCAACNQSFPVAAMDLHHLDPGIKEFEISKFNNVGYNKLQKEIEKCIPLCAVCHRLLHAGLVELES